MVPLVSDIRAVGKATLLRPIILFLYCTFFRYFSHLIISFGSYAYKLALVDLKAACFPFFVTSDESPTVCP